MLAPTLSRRPCIVPIALLLMGICLMAAPAALAIDIVDLHQNDAAGVPTTLNQTQSITGTVTVPTGLMDTFHLDVYVQDATGGINVWIYAGAASTAVATGDSVTVISRVAQYNGMTELGTGSSYTTIVNHGPASASPEALAITCADLEGSFLSDYSEPNEGRLIRLDGLTIVSGIWPESPTGNSVIYVTDGTDTAKLYIDQDTPVNGSPQPGPGFSIVGVLKQYDSSAPYTTGYEIVPRTADDVITAPGTIAPAAVRNVHSGGADILFETGLPGSSEVEYGLDDNYGQWAGDPDASETAHSVQLTGLAPNTIYHFRARSQAGGTVSNGPDQLLATSSDQPGEIHILMTHSAEHEYAGPYDEVLSGQYLPNRLASLIWTAETSVDCAFYSFSLDNIRAALIAAHQRGCQVRLIIDQNNYHGHADDCAAAGIPYIDSGHAGNHASGVMHNKFVVIDGRDADPYNDIVWTGSANLSYSGSFDVNNAVWIRDHGLARAYTLEFDEMWGSSTQSPAAGARMGNAKLDNTPHEFTINGIRVEQYMSPSDGVTGRIITGARTAQHDLLMCLLAFTHNDISAAMDNQRDSEPGLSVRGVFNQDQGACNEGSEYFALAGQTCAPGTWSPPADVWLDTAVPVDDYLHHKYLIIDPNHPGSDPTVITGSHNWSYSADTINDENTLVLHDPAIANQYLQEFAARYHESGGNDDLGAISSVHPEPATPDRTLAALHTWPNPFNPQSRISLSLARPGQVTATIHDARGQSVATLVQDQTWQAGLHVLGWNGTDDRGRAVASGSYLLRVRAGSDLETRKLVLVR